MCTTAQMRAPAEVRGACSGPSKSQILASNRGETFRPAKAKQDNVNQYSRFYILLATGCCCIMSDHTVRRALFKEAATEQL